MRPFRYAHAAGDDWREIADTCLSQLGEIPAAANLGFLYVTDSLTDDLADLLGRLKDATRVRDWVGAVGIGICATGAEYYEEPAAAVMLGEFPPDGFRVFPRLADDLDAFDTRNGEWIAERHPLLALVHGDPTDGVTEDLIEQLATRTVAGFLVGGLASSRGHTCTIANGLHLGGLSGVLFAEGVGLITRLSQGCSPIGPQRTVTKAERNIVITLDGRPALDVLKEDIGELLSRDLMHIGRSIFVGLPIVGSDTGDYLVRNLVGLDPNEGLVAVGDLMESGRKLMFCRRDGATARDDLNRMLVSLKGRLRAPPRGGVYVTCLGRGVNLFGPDSAELRQIRDTLGEVPLVGFYANGEISQDRLYGYTGVLMLFT
ncbi:FIST N-terminal domain-containing protein [uncultured Thiodictyon sp.]|uniref:FIST signal transduction protein n=1 Tax=uncultured Thiodictyon sp. TaxID=1846217 RepID=UPI0025D73B6D|nr:FIST N-terminal domain-containing protein [uncultured Thiodictyon sp.]